LLLFNSVSKKKLFLGRKNNRQPFAPLDPAEQVTPVVVCVKKQKISVKKSPQKIFKINPLQQIQNVDTTVYRKMHHISLSKNEGISYLLYSSACYTAVPVIQQYLLYSSACYTAVPVTIVAIIHIL